MELPSESELAKLTCLCHELNAARVQRNQTQQAQERERLDAIVLEKEKAHSDEYTRLKALGYHFHWDIHAQQYRYFPPALWNLR